MIDADALMFAAKACEIPPSAIEQWDPLNDDDASREIDEGLELITEIRPEAAGAFVWRFGAGVDIRVWAKISEAGSMDAAVRLARVRAAAEIGKAMP
jgi:hypothetical protein